MIFQSTAVNLNYHCHTWFMYDQYIVMCFLDVPGLAWCLHSKAW